MRKILLALLALLALVLAGCASSSSTNAPRLKTAGPYPTHFGIEATVFWVGEASDSDNHFIPNASSAWVGDWQGEFGGIDDPNRRRLTRKGVVSSSSITGLPVWSTSTVTPLDSAATR